MTHNLAIRDTALGVLITVVVKTKAKENAIVGLHGNVLKVSVTAAPQKGKANSAVVDLLAGFFGVSKSEVILRAGQTSKRKLFLIEGMTENQVFDALTKRGIK